MRRRCSSRSACCELPWLAALAVEWVVLSGAFRGELAASPRAPARAQEPVAFPWFAIAVLGATLILLPATAGAGSGAVLAMLVGVNVGPNLTFSGSLATPLWRRVMHAHDEPAELGEFTRLALAVPCVLVASTAALWMGLQVL